MGVSGIHRLLSHAEEIMTARVIVAVAGMEERSQRHRRLGRCARDSRSHQRRLRRLFGGVAALLSMLNSCASGMSVVNIDNGFGAGYLAGVINHLK